MREAEERGATLDRVRGGRWERKIEDSMLGERSWFRVSLGIAGVVNFTRAKAQARRVHKTCLTGGPEHTWVRLRRLVRMKGDNRHCTHQFTGARPSARLPIFR